MEIGEIRDLVLRHDKSLTSLDEWATIKGGNDEMGMANGSKGPEVKALQEALLVWGYKLPVHGADGDFGVETEAAVNAFRKDYDCPETGIWDEACQALLDERNAIAGEPEYNSGIDRMISGVDETIAKLEAFKAILEASKNV